MVPPGPKALPNAAPPIVPKVGKAFLIPAPILLNKPGFLFSGFSGVVGVSAGVFLSAGSVASGAAEAP